MSIALIVERRSAPRSKISLQEWTDYIKNRKELRLREEPYVGMNPVTKESIIIPQNAGDSEIFIDGQWYPFLAFRRGSLQMKYLPEFENSTNKMRTLIIDIAKSFNAIIGNDCDDDEFKW